MHTLSRRNVKDFLQTGRFKDARKIPPDHTIIPAEFLPEGTRVPSHLAQASPAPKGNPRPRFLKREKIKSRRSNYWDLAIEDVVQKNERRTWRIMRLAAMLREGWTPRSLMEAGWGEGNFWRAVHMQCRMR